MERENPEALCLNKSTKRLRSLLRRHVTPNPGTSWMNPSPVAVFLFGSLSVLYLALAKIRPFFCANPIEKKKILFSKLSRLGFDVSRCLHLFVVIWWPARGWGRGGFVAMQCFSFPFSSLLYFVFPHLLSSSYQPPL